MEQLPKSHELALLLSIWTKVSDGSLSYLVIPKCCSMNVIVRNF